MTPTYELTEVEYVDDMAVSPFFAEHLVSLQVLRATDNRPLNRQSVNSVDKKEMVYTPERSKISDRAPPQRRKHSWSQDEIELGYVLPSCLPSPTACVWHVSCRA